MSEKKVYGGKIYVGNSAKNVQSSPGGRVTQVIYHVDDNKAYVAVADPNDGLTVETTCPWATQAMADAALAAFQGYEYRPYEADSALLEPAAELGDAITTSGFYSGIYRIAKKFGRLGAANLAAPQKSEEEHELQYKTANERRWTRKMKEISAEFAVLGDRINAIVKNDGEGFGWELVSTGMTWWAIDDNKKKTIMKIDKNGVVINGTATIPAVIAGQLKVGGTAISASTLRSGANSGYNWANGSYGSSNSRWDYSLTGGGYGFNYHDVTTESTGQSASYFKSNIVNAATSFRLGGYRTTWQSVTIDGKSYTFLKQGVYTG